MRNRAGLGLNVHRFCRDYDFLRHRSHAQLQRHPQGLARVEHDPGIHQFLKSLFFGRNRIGSNRHAHHGKRTSLVGLHGPCETAIGIGDRYLDATQHGTRGIRNRADKIGEILGVRTKRGCKQQADDEEDESLHWSEFSCKNVENRRTGGPASISGFFFSLSQKTGVNLLQNIFRKTYGKAAIAATLTGGAGCCQIAGFDNLNPEMRR